LGIDSSRFSCFELYSFIRRLVPFLQPLLTVFLNPFGLLHGFFEGKAGPENLVNLAFAPFSVLLEKLPDCE
jgi:hypothetical protein